MLLAADVREPAELQRWPARRRPTLRPEVASGFPRSSADGKTLTFTLRDGFRFSDGTPVRASAFVRAINRTLAPEMKSPWAVYLRDIVGAEQSPGGEGDNSGRRRRQGTYPRDPARAARSRTSPARTSFLCAVPPALPADREGVAVIPAAGPYYITEYRPAERIVIRRNRFYGGSRPQHVDGFDVDLRVGSQEEVLDRIERGDADWGWALSSVYFDPAREAGGEVRGQQVTVLPPARNHASAAMRSTPRGRCSGTTRSSGEP